MDQQITPVKPLNYEAAYKGATESLDKMQTRAESAERRCVELEAENERLAGRVMDAAYWRSPEGDFYRYDYDRAVVAETDLAACARLVEAAEGVGGCLHPSWSHAEGDDVPCGKCVVCKVKDSLAAIPEPTRQRLAEMVKNA